MITYAFWRCIPTNGVYTYSVLVDTVKQFRKWSYQVILPSAVYENPSRLPPPPSLRELNLCGHLQCGPSTTRVYECVLS